MALTTVQLIQLKRLSGEWHKITGDRMLDDEDLSDIADESGKVVDSSGNPPSHVSYVPTYDLYRTASAVWRQKAGMIAEGYNVKVEGASFDRSDVYEHYNTEALRYAGMAASLTTDTTPPRA